jgi:dTDP-N-acetylfucosamine:lipid II N-acetylfucosaminyltransferase
MKPHRIFYWLDAGKLAKCWRKARRIFYRLDAGKLAKCWRKARFVHVMHNGKFNKDYIDLIGAHFGRDGHVFVFCGGLNMNLFPIPEYENVIILWDSSQFYILTLLFRRAQKVFFHGLFVPDLVHFLCLPGQSLEKAYWVIWGGDMYPDRKDAQRRSLKKRIVRQLRGLVVVATGDGEVARELYGFSGPCYLGLYKNPLQRESLDRALAERTENEKLVVQVNNSADTSVVQGLELLVPFAAQLREIRVILSYGDESIKDTIIETGRRLYGGKFTAVTDYMSPENYAKLIGNTDIAVMVQPRQQGLGNIYAFFYCGAKVYIRSDVSTWNYLSELGFALFDSLAISGQTFERFARMDEDLREKNHAAVIRFFDDTYLATSWRDIFAS